MIDLLGVFQIFTRIEGLRLFKHMLRQNATLQQPRAHDGCLRRRLVAALRAAHDDALRLRLIDFQRQRQPAFQRHRRRTVALDLRAQHDDYITLPHRRQMRFLIIDKADERKRRQNHQQQHDREHPQKPPIPFLLVQTHRIPPSSLR